MVGQLVFTPKGRGKVVSGRLYGLRILRAQANPEGFWGERRLSRAGKNLRLEGILRVLVPRDFARWSLLERFGLRPVDPERLIRAQAGPLALEALERRGQPPHRATVALRGLRAGRDMARIAAELCPKVRSLVIDAPQGGGELARALRQEFGIPILPPGEAGQVGLYFQAGPAPEGETALTLCGPRPQLAGLALAAPELPEEDRGDLPLLAALWEGGQLRREDIKIT